jgi:Kef-type K+ transport system membrane component KefB
VLLFLSLGLLFTLEGLGRLWPWVLGFLLARAVAKLVAVAAFARPSGLGWRQSLGLAIALQPAAPLAVLAGASTLGWPADVPAVHAGVVQAVLIGITLMQVTGPWWAQFGLQFVARETNRET